MIDTPRVAPSDVLTANDFGVRKFTGGTLADNSVHSANAVPENFKGRYLTMVALGGNVHFGFSTHSDAEIDRAVAATAAGVAAKVGGYLANGIKEDYWCPDSPPGVPMYFVREADAATGVTVLVSLSDRNV